jgi:hypothetical protein
MALTGDGAAQRSCVAVVQVVVRHGRPERYADGLGSMLEKPKPLIVTVAALETWMFTGAKDETQAAVAYVGYAARRVVPHAAYSLYWLQPESAVPSNPSAKEVTRTTFHAARFWSNADAEASACEPHRTRSTPTESPRMFRRGYAGTQTRAPALTRMHTSARLWPTHTPEIHSSM